MKYGHNAVDHIAPKGCDYEWKIVAEIEKEIDYAIKGNQDIRRDLEEADEMYYTVSGKISALRGIKEFIEELRGKRTESYEEAVSVSDTARKIYEEMQEVISTAEFADCWARENFKSDVEEVFAQYLDEEDRNAL